MGLFGSIAGTVFDVVTTPIEVAKGALTGCGFTTGEDEAYTIKRLRALGYDMDEIRQALRGQ